MIKTKKELLEKLKSLGKIDLDTKKKIVCSLIGHSNIETMCFGYVYCGRCGDQVGDKLGSIYSNDNSVIVGHNCDTCKNNYVKMNWRDKYLAPDPFKTEDHV